MSTQINPHNALPKGYELEEYRIESIHEHEKFHIIYFAHDTKLDMPVSLKEYLPNEIAVREGNYRLQPKSQKDAEEFASGLKQFTKKARALSCNNHSNTGRTLRLFDANHTTYLVMDDKTGKNPSSTKKPYLIKWATLSILAGVVVVALGVGYKAYTGKEGKTVYANTYYLHTYAPPPLETTPATAISIPAETLKDSSTWTSDYIFRDRLQEGSLGPEMVVIPAGQFRMGDIPGDGDDDELPLHSVSLKSFAMCRYEVTFDEYDRFAEATFREPPDDEGWGRGKRPVINVSWHDAMAYLKWLSEQTGQAYDLPSESQWEYAARAGTNTKYWWGNSASHDYANYGTDYCCDGLKKGKDRWKYTAPVGSFEANSFGLYDTVGNVWEWVADPDHDDYNGAPKDGRVWKEGKVGDSRLIRGGSWYNLPLYCRVTNRHHIHSDDELNRVGFRCYRRVAENF